MAKCEYDKFVESVQEEIEFFEDSEGDDDEETLLTQNDELKKFYELLYKMLSGKLYYVRRVLRMAARLQASGVSIPKEAISKARMLSPDTTPALGAGVQRRK